MLRPCAYSLLMPQDPAAAVTVDTTCLEFGTCSRLSASEYQPVTVTNRTSAKITAFFVTPPWQDAAGGPPKTVFQVWGSVCICVCGLVHVDVCGASRFLSAKDAAGGPPKTMFQCMGVWDEWVGRCMWVKMGGCVDLVM
eukprot:461434-Pelagomonas_calceolata.AAC.4